METLKKFFAIMIVIALALGVAACGEKTIKEVEKERAEKRAAAEANNPKTPKPPKTICVDGVVYFMDVYGKPSAAKVMPNGLPQTCEQ